MTHVARALYVPSCLDFVGERSTDDDLMDMDRLDENMAAVKAAILGALQAMLERSRDFQELRGGHGSTDDNDGSRPCQGAQTHPGPSPGSMGDGPLQWQSQPGNADRELVKEHDFPAHAEDLSRDLLQHANVGEDSEGPAISEETARNGSYHASTEATDLEGKSSQCTAYEGAGRCGSGYSVRNASSDGTSTSSCCNAAMNAASETNVPLITEAKQAEGHPDGGMLPQTERSSQTPSQQEQKVARLFASSMKR
ncbi:hypothetical protein MRX96_032422 [Rhipicephalus microplus]